jgi:hypothetical protein
MTVTQTTARGKKRATVAARRFGYVVAVLVNAAMLYVVNVWPGWQELGFLTEDTREVLGLVNASIVVGIAANLVYIVRDPGWLRSAGELVTTAVGLAAMIVIWEVFPFDFGDAAFDWAILVRVLLAIGIIGSVIGMFARAVSLVADTRSRR